MSRLMESSMTDETAAFIVRILLCDPPKDVDARNRMSALNSSCFHVTSRLHLNTVSSLFRLAANPVCAGKAMWMVTRYVHGFIYADAKVPSYRHYFV